MKPAVIPLFRFCVVGATIAACGDASTAARTDALDARRLGAAVAAGGTLALEDAAARVAPALGDAVAGEAIRTALHDAATAMRRGDAVTARLATGRARRALDAYAAHATRDDASDRDVIAMALDGADRLLAPARR